MVRSRQDLVMSEFFFSLGCQMPIFRNCLNGSQTCVLCAYFTYSPLLHWTLWTTAPLIAPHKSTAQKYRGQR